VKRLVELIEFIIIGIPVIILYLVSELLDATSTTLKRIVKSIDKAWHK